MEHSSCRYGWLLQDGSPAGRRRRSEEPAATLLWPPCGRQADASGGLSVGVGPEPIFDIKSRPPAGGTGERGAYRWFSDRGLLPPALFWSCCSCPGLIG